ncbi:MAG: hypothetical protein ACFFFO_15375 [Candidatus Thorarchaeota archaeon]
MISILDEIIQTEHNYWFPLIYLTVFSILIILRKKWKRTGPTRKEYAIMLGMCIILVLVSYGIAAAIWGTSIYPQYPEFLPILTVSFILLIGTFCSSFLVIAFGTKKRTDSDSVEDIEHETYPLHASSQ